MRYSNRKRAYRRGLNSHEAAKSDLLPGAGTKKEVPVRGVEGTQAPVRIARGQDPRGRAHKDLREGVAQFVTGGIAMGRILL